MNIKRILFWASFIIVILLIIWGLIVAINKDNTVVNKTGAPAPVAATDHIIGSSTAPVTIIEYSDFQCPACQAYYYVVEKLLASSTVPIRFVYRHFPLTQHVNAVPASLASEAASVQGNFWGMYKLLFENYTDWIELKDPNPVFVDYAKELGLDADQFTKDLASTTLKTRITDSVDEGTSIGVNSTPTFFINGEVITNPQSYDAFKTIVEQAAVANSK